MPEYVEKETLLRQAIEERRFLLRLEDVVNGDSVVFRTVYKDLAEFIRNAPAAEGVVPVVRCKSCVYARWSERSQAYHCQRRWNMHKVRERDFCSYGRRKEVSET